jgi:hypothetical protein
VKPYLWLLAAALPMAAQPKLLVNAQVDTRSAAAGLEAEFKALLSAQPQPAWIGYSVPSVRSRNLGCEYVHDGSFSTAGVVHLEPPDHAVVLYRVEGNAVGRIRSLSPDCEIDAGNVPVHWLTDVKPGESVALLTGFAAQREGVGDSAVSAIAMHGDPAADAALERFLAPDQPESLRARTASLVGSTRGRHGVEVLKGVIANDPDQRVKERAISGLAASREPEALDLLVLLARNDPNARLRAQALSGLGRKSSPQVLAILTSAAESDPDLQVKRRAVSALANLPDGAGVPVLIELVKNTKNTDVRKQAMNSLGSSRDPRALVFFEDVLKH